MRYKTPTKKWNVAEAKEKFSQMIREAADNPQFIFSRDRLVAAVVSPEAFREFQSWQEGESLAEAFIELRTLCAEESYILEVPQRVDRANDFANALDDVSS